MPKAPSTNPAKQERICKVRAKTNASRSGGTASAAAQDQKLRSLLDTAGDIQSLEHFTYWKDEFLDSFRDHVDPDGTATAREADDTLYFEMQELAKHCIAIRRFCDNGDISAEKCTVKGQNVLNELVSEMAKAEQAIKLYFPKTQEHEQKVGYSKFELGAVLVRDGFRVYDLMITTRDYIVALRDGPLSKGDILRRNSKSIMGFYLKEIDSFCDTMADLGMHKLMNKCRELYKIRPRRKKKKPFDRTKQDALSDTSGSDTINNGRMFRRPKQNFKSIIDEGWTSGVAGQEVHEPSGVGDDKEDGVAGSKKPREDEDEPKKPTDFIYYYDPVSEKVGKISRKACMADNLFFRRDEDGKEHQDLAVKEWDGEEGKIQLIWAMKEALKGKPTKFSSGSPEGGQTKKQ